MSNTRKDFLLNNNNDEIDINSILRTFKREKKLFITITSIVTSFGIIYSNSLKPVYKGNLDMIVKNEKNNNNSSTISPLLNNISIDAITKENNQKKTKELILKSPLVLAPIFNYVKEQNKIKGVSIENMNYKDWFKRNLDVYFNKNTNVLSVNYINNDKDLILDVLNKISEAYQSYSRKERVKKINNTLSYLEEQRSLYERKSKSSLQELNLFSIENGLGDVDGFVELERESLPLNPTDGSFQINLKNSSFSKFLKNKNSEAGQRFRNQFKLLESYEATYTDLSSRLKPNSDIMTSLKMKIDTLRLSLRRPNEILVKFNDLKKKASRNENMLNELENKLIIMKLEKVKQNDPWQVISEPTIDQNLVSPKKGLLTIIFFIIGLFISGILSLFKERKSGVIFEKNIIKTNLNCEYIESISAKEADLNTQIINSIQKKYSKDSKFGVVFLKDKEDDKAIFNYDENIKYVDNFFQESFNPNEYKKIIFVIRKNTCKSDDIKLINKYILINQDLYLGWFYLDF